MKAKKQKQKTERQHFVPKSYLARFTDDGTDEGCLQVRNITTSAHRESTPIREAFERNLYTLDGTSDPMAVEHAFVAFEGRAARQITTIEATQMLPKNSAGMRDLMEWIAIQSQRVPQRIKSWDEYHAETAHIVMELMSTNASRYDLAMAGFEQVTGADRAHRQDYDHLRAALPNTRFQIDNTSLMRNMIESADVHAELLRQRSWTLLIAPSGTPEFVTSDNPVSLVPTERISSAGPGWAYGVGTPGTIVFYPLTSRLTMLGSLLRVQLPPTVKELSAQEVAEVNSATIRTAQRWIYSRRKRVYRDARMLAGVDRLPMPPVPEELVPALRAVRVRGRSATPATAVSISNALSACGEETSVRPA
jgi:hypothetical protein